MVERVKVEIPKGVAPAVREIITPIIDEINAGGLGNFSESLESVYGHELTLLAHSAFGAEKQSEQEQLRLLKERAHQICDKYGPGIIKLMNPKLLEALGIKID